MSSTRSILWTLFCFSKLLSLLLFFFPKIFLKISFSLPKEIKCISDDQIHSLKKITDSNPYFDHLKPDFSSTRSIVNFTQMSLNLSFRDFLLKEGLDNVRSLLLLQGGCHIVNKFVLLTLNWPFCR